MNPPIKMESEILEKLGRELSVLPIDTEPRVVYTFVKIRKLLDHANDKTNPLRFYCNWVVHVVLDKKAAREKLNSLSGMPDTQISKFLNLTELRKHLTIFFEERGLNDTLIKTEKYWIPFHEQLVKILIDTPIQNLTSAISFFALQKRSEALVGGNERIEYRMIRNGKEILGNIYP